ncbi:hypothetical protein [Winogradskyella alexanderae]|uniref:Uncharacterized protein n=1 Tax=Winogradskyella alexanderae TaxID=2877123 RepID=A0ABS7XV74_9FLAO|nr:hypothetical protein [Winogradskyella alexanderae]MCA0133918.1 hypothetical protein [Winogradskyella alexanderae]
MKLKVLTVIGLLFLIINQLLLLGGTEFIQTQKPIDYAHWLLFLGVLFTLSINYVFSDNIFSNTATILTSLGAIALIGQATIDFLWWSYGTDYEGMDNLTHQIMNEPSIRIPFITIGPALFYLGLAIHAGKFIKKQTLLTIAVIFGVILTGLGSFIFDSRSIITLGHIILTLGVIGLLFKISHKQNEQQ